MGVCDVEALILDKSYATTAVLDKFESFIWTDRFRGYGDFEIYMPVETAALGFLKQDYYLQIQSSDRMMIIEELQTDTNAEEGNHLTVTGRSLESILERRVVAAYTVLSGNFQNGVQKLLNENAISPSNSKRKIPGLIFRASTDPAVTGLTLDTQFLGETLYEAINTLCEEKDIGWRVLPYGDGGFVFELYAGKDRSYDQTALPPVVFSPNFENMLSSNYLETKKSLKTAAFVGGSGEGSERTITEVTDDDGGGTGLDRRELFVDAAGVSKETVTSEEGMTEEEIASQEAAANAEYITQLQAKGKEAMAETKVTKAFEGEIDATRQFVYGKDFTIGDLVQVVNEYGMEAKSRVSELIQSQDVNGESIHPTFTSIETD